MAKRKSYEIRKKILTLVKDKPLTFAQLERKINTNASTIKQDCKELSDYKLVEVEEKIHPANGKKAYYVKLTKEGRKVI